MTQGRGSKANKFKWSKLSTLTSCLDEVDVNVVDEHGEFTRSVRAFRATLLRQFKVVDTVSENRLEVEDRVVIEREESDATPALNIGEEPYIARFVEPFPARPVFTAVLPESSPPSLPPPTAADDSSAPRVAIAFRYKKDEHRRWVDAALFRLSSHPAALTVSVCPELWESGKEADDLVLFVVVGLSAQPSETVSHRPVWRVLLPEEDATLTTSEQREIIWKAIHQALPEETGSPVVTKDGAVVEVFMLQDAWLYDRLFQWLTKRNTGRCWNPSYSVLSQEELDLIVHEFGEVTATHFLFVEAYTSHLRIAAVVAIVCFLVPHVARGEIVGWSGALGHQSAMERIPWMILAAFLPTWAFHFIASWRTRASKAGLRWLGSLGLVQNSMMENAMLEAMETASEKRARYLRILLLTVPLLLFQLMVVLCVTVTFFCIEVYIYDVIWQQFSIVWQLAFALVYNLAFGLAFMLMLGTFHPISKQFTKWERHPDPDLAEWHLTTKVFANWFFAIFLYFFVIAFCYIPFGGHIASILSAARESGDGIFGVSGASQDSRLLSEDDIDFHPIRHALETFRPDVHRLSYDIFLFFVLQDMLRLLHVLYPAARAAYGSRFVHTKKTPTPARHKRAAFMSEVVQMFKIVCSRTPLPLCRVPATPLMKMMEQARAQDGVFVAYILIESVEMRPAPEAESEGNAVMISCSMAGTKPGRAVCTALRWAVQNTGSTETLPRIPSAAYTEIDYDEDEDKDEDLDLITVTCDAAELRANRSATVHVAVSIAEFGLQAQGKQGSATWTGDIELPLDVEVATMPPPRGTYASKGGRMNLGPVRVTYKAGIVGANTHHEALDLIPPAARRMLTGQTPERPGQVPPPQAVRAEEAIALAEAGGLPWKWWDQELSGIFWDGVADLYSAKDTFETFELYGHLTTQFSYVYLFTIAVPFCPLLALMFTSMEVRQDQLRLLWLSRPPKPDTELLRFKPGVSLGAWHEIIQFTCHLSVVVNLLLWGLTYEGTGPTKPADWNVTEWWHQLALFMLCEKACGWLSRLLRKYVSQLDHETATAYLRRELRLQQALSKEEPSSPKTVRSAKVSPTRSLRRRFVRPWSPTEGGTGSW